MNHSSSLIVGIDLGTTNSLIGIYDAGFPTLLADDEGSRLTPSIVSYRDKGQVLVGRLAERQRLLHPEQTIASVKRLMGNQKKLHLGKHHVTPEEVSSEILKHLKKIAERALNNGVSRAVITVPAYFNDAQRAATRRAGELAGFTVERILSEPTAAALAYGLDKLHDQAKIAVYDLGGGTFDLSILQLDHGIFQVLSTHGDTQLGGDDLDEAIANFLLTKSQTSQKEIDSQRLKTAARQAKEQLSFVEETVVRLPFFQGTRHLEIPLTRAELEKTCRPLIERTRTFCLRALADAKLQPSDLDEIILVGGSTRMPLVQAIVENIFEKKTNLSQHPDEAVALGAVLQAALLEGKLSQITLLDITPLSLGIETFGGLMNVIIPRNTTIPTKAGEMFTNAVAGQQAMKITILQGERELAKDNWKLGEVEIPFTPAPKGQARVGVQFEIDADGILKVLVRDTISGEEKILEIRQAIEISDEAVEAMLADSLEHAFEDRDARILTEARLKAEEMLPAVESALTQLAGELDEKMKKEIRAASAQLEAAMKEDDLSILQQQLQKLDDATQILATMLVDKVLKKDSDR
ncbi:MAG: molecular chaperone DnaK [Verrucomicrobia bacterium]|nr:molecular chaperone DnaK [Verrucomicrobiota bacterium]